MTTANIRTKLHEYIDTSDETLLKMMYAVAKEYNQASEHKFSEDELALFEERRNKRLSGEGKLYSWEEAKAMITKKRSA